MLDERWIKAMHVEALREEELHAGRESHVLFQASTIGALLDGAYEGDLSFADLAAQGDLGLGTLNGLDGEMIALDGRFYRADVEGAIHHVAPEERTPFAVVTRFEPVAEFDLEGPLPHATLLERLDDRVPSAAASAAVRLDGSFERLRLRSVPRQSPPYRPLPEVAAEQNVFELADVEGTMLGFRFPDYVEGIEVAGYHLHFITADRSRGGHVLDSRRRDFAPASTHPATSTSSCRTESASATPTSRPRPTRRSPASRAPISSGGRRPTTRFRRPARSHGGHSGGSRSGRWGRG